MKSINEVKLKIIKCREIDREIGWLAKQTGNIPEM